MLEAVFISDLHLNPETPAITERFYQFLEWAKTNTKTLYILGDFFHAWPGDDGINAFSQSLIKALNEVATQGIPIYFMPGNRDFLIGKKFITAAGLRLLKDPSIITCNHIPILLSHGDRYCTLDKSHQWLMKFTRNSIFSFLFKRLPLKFRQRIVGKVRTMSAEKKKTEKIMDTVDTAILKEMQDKNMAILIHGHTHKPGLKKLVSQGKNYQVYILSDWDDNPSILCYHIALGFYFDHDFSGGSYARH